MATTQTHNQTDLEIKNLVDAELAWTPSVNAVVNDQLIVLS